MNARATLTRGLFGGLALTMLAALHVPRDIGAATGLGTSVGSSRRSPPPSPAPAREQPSAGHRIETPLSDRVANYTIDVRLDPETARLHGSERITWTNRSPDPVEEIRLHLYWNAFRDDQSTYFRDLGTYDQRSGPARFGEDDRGSMDILSIRFGEDDLGDLLEFVAPDDGNAHDRTVARVPLPRPVLPGETAAFDIRFEARVPRLLDRAGRAEDFFVMGQWFPKIGVLEYPGIRGAAATRWVCHQYHPFSEFYADFGTYDVSITVPERFEIAATGVRMDTSPARNGQTTYRYRQADVHDFTWVAWPDFLEIDDACALPGGRTVQIHLALSPEQIDSAAYLLDAAKDALRWLSSHLFPYPYPRLTIVAAPHNAKLGGGMEYATLILVGADVHPRRGGAFMRSTVVHETTHQYWQGVIANNEAEDPWIDEGFTTWIAARIENDTGEKPGYAPFFRLPLGYPVSFSRPRILPADLFRAAIATPVLSPMTASSWEFLHARDYFNSTYGRVGLVLETVAGIIGEDGMMAFLRDTSRRWAFRHPSTADILEALRAHAGPPVDDIVRQLVVDTRMLDYTVTRVQSAREDERDGYLNTVVVERLGGAVYPVTLTITLEDGSRRIEHWDGHARWKRFVFEEEAPAVSAEVDARGILQVDSNLLNNGHARERDRTASARLTSLLVTLEQLAMSLFACLL